MNKDIFRLAIPNIISNITIPLLGLVDLALMGHLNSELYIGAIALGGVIFNFIYWGFGFLRMSTTGFTAQAVGMKNDNEPFVVLMRALVVGIGAGMAILLVQRPIATIGFGLIGGSEEVKVLAKEYFLIRIWAVPAALSQFVFSGWFLGMQNARYPMIIAITANVLNILFSMFFVFGLDMKSDGVALGTVLAQYTGFLLAIFLFLNTYRKLIVIKNISQIFTIKSMSRFFSVNTDIFIRSFCIILVFTFFTSESASTNDTILAVNSLLIQMLMFFSFFIDGFAYAGEALAGKYFGAKQKKKLKQVVKQLFIWGIGMALLFTLIYATGIDFILRLLTSQQDILDRAQPYIIWVLFIPLASFSSFIWDGIYIGTTASEAMRNTLLVSAFFVFAPVYYLLSPVWGNHALWLAMILFMLSRGVFQTLFFKRHIIMRQ